MTIIRPMCLVHEADLMELAQVRGYRKQVKNCPYESQSSRSTMKGILKQLEEMNPEARYSLWGSMTECAGGIAACNHKTLTINY